MPLHAAIDFGLTNIDAVLRDPDGRLQTFILPSNYQPVTAQLEAVLGLYGYPLTDFEWIAVTGGQFRQLPPTFGGVRLLPVNEVPAIGRGGLYLAGLDSQGKKGKAKKDGEALVVSAGSGTAMVAARGCQAHHVTGSAVGGGTLQGLGRLLLGTADARVIDQLAQQGNANAADLTLAEAIGSTVGRLPPDANAVNFGPAGAPGRRSLARRPGCRHRAAGGAGDRRDRHQRRPRRKARYGRGARAPGRPAVFPPGDAHHGGILPGFDHRSRPAGLWDGHRRAAVRRGINFQKKDCAGAVFEIRLRGGISPPQSIFGNTFTVSVIAP